MINGEKSALITQSNYIPWKGYFANIIDADVFVIYDTVQYTRRDWRNRNQIKTPSGIKWLTIPVCSKGKYTQTVCDTRISDPTWTDDHWSKIYSAYSRSPRFAEFAPELERLYRTTKLDFLTDINEVFLLGVMGMLGIKTEVCRSSDFDAKGDSSSRLLEICRKLNATTYITGPSAKEYLNEDLFDQDGISISYSDYEGFPEYSQMNGSFVHSVSIVDLLLNVGNSSREYVDRVSRTLP